MTIYKLIGRGPRLDLTVSHRHVVWAISTALGNLTQDELPLTHMIYDYHKRLPEGFTLVDGTQPQIIHGFGHSFTSSTLRSIYTSTVAHMLYQLSRILETPDLVILDGFQLHDLQEYQQQREAVAYWIGVLEGRGHVVSGYQLDHESEAPYPIGYIPVQLGGQLPLFPPNDLDNSSNS